MAIRNRRDIPRAAIAQTVGVYRSGRAVARDLAALCDELIGELAGALRDAQPGAYRQPARQAAAWDRLNELVSERLERYITAGSAVLDSMWAPTVIDNAGFGVDVLNAALGADIIPPPRTTLARLRVAVENQIVMGSSVSDWWTKHTSDIKQRFLGAARTAATNGLNATQTMEAEATLGSLAQARYHVRAMGETATATAANAGATVMYEEASIRGIVEGVQQIAVLDSRTCRTCVKYDHKIWVYDGVSWRGQGHDLPQGPPPANTHYRCRCSQLPTLADWSDMPADVRTQIPASQRASVSGPVAGDADYDRWVTDMSDDDLREIFGARVAARIRAKKIRVNEAINDADFGDGIRPVR